MVGEVVSDGEVVPDPPVPVPVPELPRLIVIMFGSAEVKTDTVSASRE